MATKNNVIDEKNESDGNTGSGKKGFSLTMANKNAIAGYLFILPFIIGFLLFMAYPLFQSLRMAFSSVSLDFDNHTFAMEWSGLQNLRRAFIVDADFTQLVTEELLRLAFVFPAVLIFSFFIAVLLNAKFPGRAFVRAVFFLPVILASGVLVGIETNNELLQAISAQIQDENALRANITGVLETILLSGTGGWLNVFMQYVLDIVNELYTIAMASGIQILIFLAGLQTISPSIFEASSIEGATAWENFWKITFPMMSPMILVVTVYTIVDYLVRTDSEVMEAISDAITGFHYGFGSAMAWSYFAIMAVILAVLSAIISLVVYYYD